MIWLHGRDWRTIFQPGIMHPGQKTMRVG